MRSAPTSSTYDFEVIELCADLVRGDKQNVTYWKTVPVPLDPNRAIPNEGLLRLLVFLPLAAVSAVYGFLGVKWGGGAFAVALPTMVALHNGVRRKVVKHLHAAAELDQGRYAAVNYLADKMGLAPKDITWGLVSELAVIYAKAWLKAEADQKAAQAAAREAAAAEAEAAKRRGRANGRYTGGHTTAGAAVGAAGVAGVGYAVADAADAPEVHFDTPACPVFNPANGQLMANDLVDVHGNTYGTTNVDDAMDYSAHHGGSGSFDYVAPPVFDTGSFGAAHGYGFE